MSALMQYKIGGCDVKFPHQAYGTQLSFMSKVIQALEAGQNALLEAPTGSGKTLSLLCASLAWQEREKRRIEEEIAACQKFHPEGVHSTPNKRTSPDPNFQVSLSPLGETQPNQHEPKATVKVEMHNTNCKTPENLGDGGFIPEDHPAGAVVENPLAAKKPPKIYYATRTHSQIAQVVRELKRSGYHPRMAVLASKQQYCINAHARSQPSLEEACEEMLKGPEVQCQYFRGVRGLQHHGASWRAHDIEDLAKVGKSHKACPYYVSRLWAADADLVFGPYSYLVDPVIRRSISIDLSGTIVIFDEAHNIEDVSRESASLEMERLEVIEADTSLGRALKYNGKHEVYEPLKNLTAAVLQWINRKNQEMDQIGGPAGHWPRHQVVERMWQGPPLLDELQSMGMGHESVEILWDSYTAAREDDEMLAMGRGQSKQAQQAPTGGTATTKGEGGSVDPLKAVRVGSAALGCLSRLIQIVRMLHESSEDGGRDYRLVFQRIPRNSLRAGGSDRSKRPRLIVGPDGPVSPGENMLTLSLWCLNPAVAFRGVAGPAHSIILTSGTLAPVDSFASELGVPFEVRLEAPHVVNMQRQVWAGVLGAGPSGSKLLATYQHTDTSAFQDSLGATVIAACRTIPDGVLLFLPSYALLEKLATRWQGTGVWSRLAQMKTIVREPRGGGSDALAVIMAEYYQAIAEGRGGLFMAVCRGKVSEGLDFADANARGVLIVGIPFPNVKDAKVEAKRKFNDAGARTLGLLPGGVWYEQQAFRALNQAIGRCIRHRGDWGAIVLIDERFYQPRYQKGLSRWVRGALTPHQTFDSAVTSMQAFFKRLTADPPAQPPKLAEPAVNPPPCEPEPPVAKVDAISLLMAGARSTRANQPPAPEYVNVMPAQPSPPEFHSCEPGIEQRACQQGPHLDLPGQTTMPVHDENVPPCASLRPDVLKAPLHRWIQEEFPVWCRFVLVQGGNAPDDDEIQSLARSGLLHAFDVARETLHRPSLQERYGWLATVALECPRGLQSVICMDEAASQLRGGGKITFDAEAMTFGTLWKRQGHAISHALDEMQRVYAEILGSLQWAQDHDTVGNAGHGGFQHHHGAANARQAAFQHAVQANASDGFYD